MSLSWRGFRYQTGEVKEIAEKLKQGEIVPVDIDEDEELDVLIKDLEQEGIFRVKGLSEDYDALDTVENPEFRFRLGFYTQPVTKDEINDEQIMYIDVFTIEEPEESYDEVFWG